jgi:hypothetical protein
MMSWPDPSPVAVSVRVGRLHGIRLQGIRLQGSRLQGIRLGVGRP